MDFFFRDLTEMRRDSLSAERVGSTRIVHGTNNLPRLEAWLVNKTGGTLTAGRPYLLRYTGDPTTNLQVIVPVPSNTSGFAATSGIVTPDIVVIAGAATLNNAYGWFAYRGYRTIFVDGTTDVATGDPLCITVATSAVSLIKRTDAASEGVFDVAYACEAQTVNSAVLIQCCLTGRLLRIR